MPDMDVLEDLAMTEHAQVDSYFVFVSTHHDQLAVWCEAEHKDSLCSHIYASGKRGFCVATPAIRDDGDDRFHAKIYHKEKYANPDSPLNGAVVATSSMLQPVLQMDGEGMTLVRRVKGCLEASHART